MPRPGKRACDRYQNGRPNGFTFRPLGPGDCKSCHYGEFVRTFDWNEFWPSIAHGKAAGALREGAVKETE